MDEGIASFRRVDRDEAVCLVVAGEIDLSVADALTDAVAALIRDAHSPAVVDLSGVTFFNSTGLNALIEAKNAADAADVQLVVEAPQRVLRVLELTGMTDAFELRAVD